MNQHPGKTQPTDPAAPPHSDFPTPSDSSPSSAISAVGADGAPAGLQVIWVDPQQVFNLPLFESYFVIDTRAQHAFVTEGHALSAVNVPCDRLAVTPPDQHAAVVHNAIAETIEDLGAPERWSPVVIFHDETDARSESTAASVIRVVAEARTLAAQNLKSGAPTSKAKSTIRTWSRNLASVRQIWRVRGGARAFAALYAPLVFGASVSFETSLPSPRHMTPNVFLGSRAMGKLPREILEGLAIRKVIVASSFATEHAIDGVEYLACHVQDSNAQDMTACWESTNVFLDAAEQAGERVLIFLHGRSRSASVLLAWILHREPGLSFEAAWARVADPKFGFRADRRLVYEDQLRRSQTRAIRSSDDQRMQQLAATGAVGATDNRER